jgi:signal transduction histidine kinase
VRRERDPVEAFLWGEVLLFALLGAALALFLTHPGLRTSYHLPELKVVLATLFALTSGLVAALTATRFAVEGRRVDLLLCCGFFVTALSWLAFSIVPAVAQEHGGRTELWAAIVGRLLGAAVIAAAPLAYGRARSRRFALVNVLGTALVALVVVWAASRSLGFRLPNLANQGAPVPASLIGANAVGALLSLLAVIGFSGRYRKHRQDLDSWLALGSTLLLAASLHYIFTPLLAAGDVSQGDFIMVLAYGVLLVGVWRAIRRSEFGRAVAEERARVAREIHDGLAQYLFAIATHASMLEAGADPAEILPKLKGAALAAQQEARFAILALSSASGRSPFDAALRRFVDVLTADGALDVDLEIDPLVHLGPDEQIEVFRIVQEGLANARLHAGARTAWVTIGGRGGRRVVAVRDDGHGFDSDAFDGAASGESMGQGLRNMRERAAAIGGALSLRSTPGSGTSVEVVLRA